jgi:hypothetical protein
VFIMNKRFSKNLYLIIPLMLLMVTAGHQNISAQTPANPPFLWAVSAGGDGSDGAMDLTVDNQDNIIVTGYFSSAATFGDTTLQTAGSADIFIAKYSSAGDVLWAVQAGGAGYDEGYSVTTDNLGNILITGIFSGTATFGTTTLNSFGNYDIFVAKCNTNGVFQWAQQGGGQNYDYGYEVATDNQNNVLVTGQFTQFATFGSFTVQSANPYGDIYVVKYNSLGAVQWVTAATDPTGGQSYYNISYGVRADNNNNVFITGSFSNIITFGITPDDTTLVSSFDGTNPDIFLAKYDQLGNLSWVAQVGSDSSLGYPPPHGQDIRIDNSNNILFTGAFSKQAIFGNLPPITGLEGSDIFLAKYDQSGNALWAVQDHVSPLNNTGTELDLDAAGNISLISGVHFAGAETDDIYFSRYTNTGTRLWGIVAGLSGLNTAGGLANDSQGDIYGCGEFYYTGVFGTDTLTGVMNEAFVAKLPSPKYSIIPGQVNFGTVPILTLDTTSVNLENTSEANLHISSISLMNDTSGSFALTSLLDSIPGLQSRSLTVNFMSMYPGFKDAFIEITSDASTSPDTIFVSGTGIIPSLALSDSILDFGSVDVGITSPINLYIFNQSPADILIDSVTITGNNVSDFSYTPDVSGDTLHPADIISLEVSFAPDTSGLKDAYLTIYSTSGSSPDIVHLTGIGLSSIQVQLPSAPMMGQPTQLNITPPSSTPYDSSSIFYRRTGDLVYQQDTLSNQGNIYTANIPSTYSTIRGIQFYVIFYYALVPVTYPSLNPDTNPASIQVNIPQMNFPNPVKVSEYQMFSVPLSINSSEIDSVFEDDYGTYNTRVWRIFRWRPGTNDYAEHNAISGNVIPGNAFWLINKDGKTFDVDNSLSVPSFNNYTIALQPGYNQIGNPFAFPVDWSLIENASLIPQLPIYWNADTQEYEMDQLILQPWEGYWVFNPLNQIINLIVNPNAFLGKKQSVNVFASFRNDEFLVRIKAFLNSGHSNDKLNYIGMMEDAKNDLNKYDVIKPPAINDQIKVLVESDGNYYARNVVPVSKDGAYWDFTVETKSPNQPFTLAVDRKSSLPENFNIWMLDRNRETPVNINNGSAEAMTQDNGKSSFRIIIGTEDFAKLHSENISLKPYEYALYQNYPNPFNPSTYITYQLKEKGNVTLEIFDILGERVKSVVDNVVQEPGQHIVTWNGRNSSGEKVSSGIYIYRLKAKDFISSKKMILLK